MAFFFIETVKNQLDARLAGIHHHVLVGSLWPQPTQWHRTFLQGFAGQWVAFPSGKFIRLDLNTPEQIVGLFDAVGGGDGWCWKDLTPERYAFNKRLTLTFYKETQKLQVTNPSFSSTINHDQQDLTTILFIL